MKVFKPLIVLLVGVLLSACNTTSESAGLSPSDTLDAQREGKRQFVGHDGGTLKFGNIEIVVPEGAVTDGTWFEVSKNLPEEQRKLKFPEYEDNRILYFIDEVPKSRVTKAFKVRTNFSAQSNPASLIIKNENDSEKAKDEKENESKIQHIFSQAKGSSKLNLASTGRSGSPIILSGFLNTIGKSRPNEPSEAMFYEIDASEKRYLQHCLSVGGDPSPGWCNLISVPAKQSVENTITVQAVSATLKVLSWNLGNDDIFGAGCSFSSYKVKLCSITTEVAATNELSRLYKSTTERPDVILFQELWHGRCNYITDSNVDRVCGLASRKIGFSHQIKLLLQNSYVYRCATPRDTGSSWEDGYECVALNPAKFSFLDGTTDIFAGVTALRPVCNALNPGIDTGFTSVKANYIGSTRPITFVTTHLAAPPYIGCRADQILNLRTTFLAPSPNLLLIGGDFNTEPFNDFTAAGDEFKRTFSQFGEFRDPSKMAHTLDNSREITTSTIINAIVPITVSQLALDHVLSNLFSGTCARGAVFLGTDHVRTICTLTGNIP